jgi:nucleoid-associated protein EbfC
MKDLAQIMQQAQAMQTKMAEVQAKIEATEADGVAGAGLVRVKLKGKGELVSAMEDAMRAATSGMGGLLPGFKLPF